MPESEETIYSTMFSSLKHPVRRKILRMLSEKPTGFSVMLEQLGVSSSHLTYHLESLGELLSKSDSGDYRLSTFGVAAVGTMRIVEDAPAVQTKNGRSRSKGWKPVIAGLIISLVLLASFSALQYNALTILSNDHNELKRKYDQLLDFTASTDKAISFLRDVIQLDLTKYEATLLSNTVDDSSDLSGVIEQTLRYSLTSSESTLDVVFRFKNNMLSSYQLLVLDGSVVYAEPQPFIVLDSAKWLLQKLWSYEDAPYLADMNRTLYQFNEEVNSIQLTEGKMKFNMSVSGANGAMHWYYSESDVDFVSKGLKFIFENQVLKALDDTYFLYTIGNAQVNVDQAGAIQAARNAVKGYSWSNGGQQVSYQVLDQPVTAVFDPKPRAEVPLALIPHWTVTLYLDTTNQPTNVNRLQVEVWADTGKVEHIRTLSG